MSITRTELRRLGLAWCFLASTLSASSVAQSSKPPDGAPPAAPGPRKLAGEDARRADQLDKEIERGLEADRWAEAIAKARELHALWARAQGPKHFETVNV